MTQTATTADYVLTAPCGCTFEGRVYSLAKCVVMDTATATGREQMQHAMKAKKRALRKPSTDELFDVIERSEYAAGSLL